MAVDTGTFVEPAVAEACVHTRHNIVLRAINQEVRQIKTEGCVAIVVATNEAAVDEDQHAAEGAVELDCDAPALVARRNLKLAPVPAHAGLRVAAAKGFESMGVQRFVAHKGQLDRPIVGQAERAPLRIVKPGLCEFEIASLGKVSLAVSESEIASRVRAVAELKLPVKVEQQPLAGR